MSLRADDDEYLKVAEFWRYCLMGLCAIGFNLLAIVFAAGMLYYQIQSIGMAITSQDREIAMVRNRLELNPPMSMRRQEEFDRLKDDVLELKTVITESFKAGRLETRGEKEERVRRIFQEMFQKERRQNSQIWGPPP